MSDAAEWMQVLTLPCGRDRHGSCAGEVRLGIAALGHVHTCICPCHHGSSVARHPSMGARSAGDLTLTLEPA